MGIWDDLRLTAGKLLNRNVSVIQPGSNAFPIPNDSDIATSVPQISDAARYNGAQKLKEHAAGPHRLDKIGRILTNISKLAVDSAVSESLKGVTGGIQVNKIVKEGLNDQLSSDNANENKKPDLTIVVEEMQAKMEKMQEDMNSTKQQNDISIQCAQGSEPLKEFSTPPVKGSVPLKTDAKKIMIRSRL
ncbi:uncharacterized protein LOC132308519 [Cornus florida]|uniref:uncharacterized protein LOC132308519 n=1 Tax=Cornus florida TaxID=4283 RepID=UPI00289C2368|nr:uncharacterized protein LOC132308519 [Cornus florida]